MGTKKVIAKASVGYDEFRKLVTEFNQQAEIKSLGTFIFKRGSKLQFRQRNPQGLFLALFSITPLNEMCPMNYSAMVTTFAANGLDLTLAYHDSGGGPHTLKFTLDQLVRLVLMPHEKDGYLFRINGRGVLIKEEKPKNRNRPANLKLTEDPHAATSTATSRVA